jgi:hypothetical protein
MQNRKIGERTIECLAAVIRMPSLRFLIPVDDVLVFNWSVLVAPPPHTRTGPLDVPSSIRH